MKSKDKKQWKSSSGGLKRDECEEKQRTPGTKDQHNKLRLTDHAFYLLVLLVIFSVYVSFALIETCRWAVRNIYVVF